MEIEILGKTLIISTPPEMTRAERRISPPDFTKISLLLEKISRVEINMASTRNMDQQGVATIMSLRARVASKNAKFTVVNANDSVELMFRIANCHKLFPIH